MCIKPLPIIFFTHNGIQWFSLLKFVTESVWHRLMLKCYCSTRNADNLRKRPTTIIVTKVYVIPFPLLLEKKKRKRTNKKRKKSHFLLWFQVCDFFNKLNLKRSSCSRQQVQYKRSTFFKVFLIFFLCFYCWCSFAFIVSFLLLFLRLD